MGRSDNGRPQLAVGQLSWDAVDLELSHLVSLSLTELRAAWANRFGTDAPKIRSREVLLRMLTWQIQEETFGGVDANTERTLSRIAAALERDGTYEPKVRRDVSAGVVLTRAWKGVVHTVTVTTNGFQHLGKCYKSLSDVARTITGTRWSGPRFFGLEQKSSRATARVSVP
jgi:hypothetical protein